MPRFRTRLTLLTLGGVLAAACAEPPVATEKMPRRRIDPLAVAAPGPSVNAAIAELRRATARAQRIDWAEEAGWDAAITSCWYHGGLGAMGYHYGDTTRIDGIVEADRPEALVYEPMKNGKLRLVAAEYIVPIALWTGSEPPALFGREFDRLDNLGIYALHVWAWAPNPDGMFAPWNPRVSCAFAEESEDRGLSH